MNPEERSLLERTYKMVEENNEILKTLRRASRIGIAVKIFYWVVIIGISVGSLYFIQPYIDVIKGDETENSSGIAPTNSYAENVQSLFQSLTE